MTSSQPVDFVSGISPMICPLRRRRLRFAFLMMLGGVVFVTARIIVDPQYSYNEFSDVMIPLKSNHVNQEEYIDKRGIHVVVGHYMGEYVGANSEPNLTEEILNENGFAPNYESGAQGMPVVIPTWEGARMQLLHKINKFNLLASDRIPLNRTLPDVRNKKCQEKYERVKNLPSTSVIIVFHNEAWSTLLRTVHSVINRSPRNILKEIILVDDASERLFLKKDLESHIAKLPVPTFVIRLTKRSGLIRARLAGAEKATGDILTFLDAHCECTTGWLVPLVSRIAEDRTRVVCPIIDIIDENTFQYVRSFELHWGAFNWDLHYRWYPLDQKQISKRKKDATDAYQTPAMAGGLFSIDRLLFYKIGAYDKKMDIWGGENLEMSFRVWMCGGSVEMVPCSHVGHVFRKSSPYSFPGEGGVGGILYRNLARVAMVWMDDWKSFFFKMNPEAAMQVNNIDIEERKFLRTQLGCHTFEWYLDNIWSNNFFPSHNSSFGKLRHKQSSRCIQRPQYPGGSTYATGIATLKECVIEIYAPQSFVFNQKGFIMTDENVCLDAPDHEHSNTPQVRFMPCIQKPRQQWTYDQNLNQLRHFASEKCLDLPTKDNPETLSLQKCSIWSKTQKWLFQHEDWT